MGVFHNGWAQLTDWLAPWGLTTWGTPAKRMSRICFFIFPLEKSTRVQAHRHTHAHRASFNNDARKKTEMWVELCASILALSAAVSSLSQKNSLIRNTFSIQSQSQSLNSAKKHWQSKGDYLEPFAYLVSNILSIHLLLFHPTSSGEKGGKLVSPQDGNSQRQVQHSASEAPPFTHSLWIRPHHDLI